jgi:xanthine/CO dehydrogenase XdhC/CoxF family maturation factor
VLASLGAHTRLGVRVQHGHPGDIRDLRVRSTRGGGSFKWDSRAYPPSVRPSKSVRFRGGPHTAWRKYYPDGGTIVVQFEAVSWPRSLVSVPLRAPSVPLLTLLTASEYPSVVIVVDS